MSPNYRLRRWLMAVAVLLCAGMIYPPRANAGFYNENFSLPANQTSFTIVFDGNQTGNFNLADYVNTTGGSGPSESFDGTNTLLTYSIPAATPAGTYHFGYDTNNGPYGVYEYGESGVLAKYSSTGSGPTDDFMPAPTITFGETSVGAYMIVLVGAEFTAADGQPYTGILYEWAEIPINLPVDVPVIIGNYLNDDLAGLPDDENPEPDTTLQLNSAQYLISPLEIPLGELNSDNYPTTNPNFQPLPGFVPGTTLGPGDTVTYTVSPEPASLTLLVTGVFGFFGYGWRRRKEVVARP